MGETFIVESEEEMCAMMCDNVVPGVRQIDLAKKFAISQGIVSMALSKAKVVPNGCSGRWSTYNREEAEAAICEYYLKRYRKNQDKANDAFGDCIKIYHAAGRPVREVLNGGTDLSPI